MLSCPHDSGVRLTHANLAPAVHEARKGNLANDRLLVVSTGVLRDPRAHEEMREKYSLAQLLFSPAEDPAPAQEPLMMVRQQSSPKL